MKKGAKLLCGILGVAFLATGCATVGNVNNTEKEVIYNGNAAVCVGDYVYFGNSLADYTTFTSDSSYKTAAQVSYLNRLNAAVKFSATSKDYSPKDLEKVNDEVVGQSNNFMFALGDYIYFSTPKREQEKDDKGVPQYVYSHSTIYRSKLNGDNKSAIYKTTGDISNIEVLKYNGKYYIVMLEGTNLVKIEVGNNYSSKVIAKDVTSIAIPKTYQKTNEQSTLDWNGQIIYTTSRKDEDNADINGTKVSKIAVDTEKTKTVFEEQGVSVNLLGRERDVVFYTIDSVSYAFDTNASGAIDLKSSAYKIYGASISDVNLIATNQRELGLLYTSNSKTIYRTTSGVNGVLNFKANGESVSASVVTVSGRTVLLASSTGLYKADLSTVYEREENGSVDVECQTIATHSAIKSDLVSYDGKYVYYYAQLENVEEDESITETDSNYYLYRAEVNRENDYQLLSLTQTSDRHSK